jgi:hypothetical protein
MKESLHFAGLRQHISVQCNSAAPAITPAPESPTVASKSPVLADGRYDAYIRQVNTRGDYLVVDLVQVFH